MPRKLLSCLPIALLTACAKGPDSSNLSAYCTAENGYRLGSQSKAYFGGCPKAAESAFLSGLQRGRAVRPNPPQAMPYFERMELLEKQLLAAGSDAERDAVRTRLRDAEWWAIHIVTNQGTYSNF
jgi:hypothetical protein